MKNFDLIFNCMFLAIMAYQVLYFLVQYVVLKRTELFYYSMFLLCLSMYYYVYVLSDILVINFKLSVKTVFSALQLSFQFISNLFYILFIIHYLELQKARLRIYKLLKYYKYYNLLFIVVFVILGILQIQSKTLFGLVSLLTLPITIALLAMLWRINSTYSKAVLFGTSCTVIGTLISHALINSGANTYILYGGNVYVPVQAGLLLDIFILGYGLSLKAAESDKKLVQTLLENQQIIEVERSRLAKDLHDGLGGLLSGIKLTLHSLEDTVPVKNAPSFLKATNQLDTVIKEMRRVAHNMMPEALLKFGLGEAMQDYCDGINESNVVKMKYTQIGSLQTLSQSTEIILYRIIQELTNNAFTHAMSKNIFIQITKHPHGFTITIEDDGKGLDVHALPDAKGTGLVNVQSRIDYLKGEWDIRSEHGKGTSINIEIPN